MTRRPKLRSFIGTILIIVAAGIFIRGFESIGLILLRQQLRFAREFAFNIGIQLLSVPVTILLALELRSYLALALGMLFRDVAQTALSYVAAPHRPKVTLKNWRDLWNISQWNLVLSFIGAIQGRIAVVILGVTAFAVGQGLTAVVAGGTGGRVHCAVSAEPRCAACWKAPTATCVSCA